MIADSALTFSGTPSFPLAGGLRTRKVSLWLRVPKIRSGTDAVSSRRAFIVTATGWGGAGPARSALRWAGAVGTDNTAVRKHQIVARRRNGTKSDERKAGMLADVTQARVIDNAAAKSACRVRSGSLESSSFFRMSARLVFSLFLIAAVTLATAPDASAQF